MMKKSLLFMALMAAGLMTACSGDTSSEAPAQEAGQTAAEQGETKAEASGDAIVLKPVSYTHLTLPTKLEV